MFVTALAIDINAFLPFILIAVMAIFIFFSYRSNKKQERELNRMRNSLKIGDEITTIGGIVGKVISVKGDHVVIETGNDKTKIKFVKTAISRVNTPN